MTTTVPTGGDPSTTAADTPAVRCAGLVHVYRVAGTDIAALRGVDLRVDPGERVALLGPSGSGKSTLLSVLAGLLRPSAGTVTVFGADIGQASEAQLLRYRGDTVGLMLQGTETNLLLYADATDNVTFATGTGFTSSGAPVGEQILRAAGLDRNHRPVGELSPSQQQTVALAVAMATTPRLLLADEPTSQLDDTARDALLDILLHVTAENNTTVLVVTHDEHIAARMGRMVHLRDGRVGAEATSAHRYAVLGVDGSIQLPDDIASAWPAGSLIDVQRLSPDEVRIRLAPTHAP